VSQSNIEIVRGIYEAVDRGDFDAAGDPLHPEFEVHLAGIFLDLEPVHRGRDVVQKLVAHGSETWEEVTIKADRIVDLGERTLVLAHFQAKGREGIEVQRPIAHLWTMRNGQAVRMDAYADQQEAMSQVNVENLRAFLETLDVEAWRRGEDMSLLDPDVTYEDTTLPDHVGETYRGHEGVARATARWAEAYEELTIGLDRIVGAGDRLVSIHRVRGRARHTGIEAEGPVAYLWTFRDGKVIHFQSYRDPDEALEAAGLRDS
jgi:ketosteroid isomerase-like protein